MQSFEIVTGEKDSKENPVQRHAVVEAHDPEGALLTFANNHRPEVRAPYRDWEQAIQDPGFKFVGARAVLIEWEEAKDDDGDETYWAKYSSAFQLFIDLEKAQENVNRLQCAVDSTVGLDRESNVRQLKDKEAEVARIRAEIAKDGRGQPDATLAQDAAPKQAAPHDELSRSVDDGRVEEEVALLFDPVQVKTLEAMFPDSDRWKRHAERAARNGLRDAAKTSRGKFNPYFAARWWIDEIAPPGWKWERCVRVLANNLPHRSLDSKHLLTGDYD